MKNKMSSINTYFPPGFQTNMQAHRRIMAPVFWAMSGW